MVHSLPKDRGELWKFFRRPSDLARYRAHIEKVEKLYGSIRSYALAEILGWNDSHLEGSPGASIRLDRCEHTDREQCQQETFFDASDDSGYFVQETPFPYAVSSSEFAHLLAHPGRARLKSRACLPPSNSAFCCMVETPPIASLCYRRRYAESESHRCLETNTNARLDRAVPVGRITIPDNC
jgi:hypothetical protein